MLNYAQPWQPRVQRDFADVPWFISGPHDERIRRATLDATPNASGLSNAGSIAEETLCRLAPSYALSFVLAILLFDMQGVIIKFLGDRYPVQQLAAFRNVFGLIPSILVL